MNITVPIGSTSATNTATFSPAFTNVPRPSTVLAGTANPFTVSEPLMFGSATFLAVESAGQVWAPVPAGTTEVFGDTLHRIVYQTASFPGPFSSVTSASFSVACSATIPITTTEFLRPQWYDTAIGTWESVSSTTTGLDWIWGLGNCPYALGTVAVSSVINASMPKSAFSVVPLRIVGGNGDGTISSITIQQLSLQFFGTISMRPTCSVISVTKTVLTLSADYPFPILSNAPVVPCIWEAFAT